MLFLHLDELKYYSISKKKSPLGDIFLFLGFLEGYVLPEGFAELLELDLSLDFLLVLSSPICFARFLIFKLYKLNL